MRYIPDFLAVQQCDRLLELLNHDVSVKWQREQFSLFGKTLDVPRQLAWFGDHGVNYRYTGLDHFAAGWPEWLKTLQAQVSTIAAQNFNFLLLNRYADGREYMGWHRDNEKAADATIASLSLGAQRRFKYQDDQSGEIRNVELANGSLLIFDGRMRHMLAKTRRPVGLRINLTFRTIQCHGASQRVRCA
jgi:alkylated DNA repair dioxygenase AlkB